MIIEVRKVQFNNKGAELMLHAILDKASNNLPNVKFAMVPDLKYCPYEKRAELKLLQKFTYRKARMECAKVLTIIPKKFLYKYGIILDKDIDIVFDAAGFAYSDQWTPYNIIELADSCKIWKKNNTKIILLPQAFGPFESTKSKRALKYVSETVDLMYARERVSYEYITNIVGERPNIRIAPDFTTIVQGKVPPELKHLDGRFCIIPNSRMIDKTSTSISNSYLPFLVKCIDFLAQKGQKPFILIHETGNDLQFANLLRNSVKHELPIITEDDPLKIKGIIGLCAGVLSSRFHGLVSALSQGIPSMATAWSHKYVMLFKDYNFTEGVLNLNTSFDENISKIENIIDPQTRKQISDNLKNRSSEQKRKVEQMWHSIFDVLS